MLSIDYRLRKLLSMAVVNNNSLCTGSYHEKAQLGPCIVMFIPDMQNVHHRDVNWHIQYTGKETH